MKTLILANSTIVAVADTVTTTPTGYTTPDGVFPFTAGVTGIATVANLPADFASTLYEWNGSVLVRLPDPPAPPTPVPQSVTPRQARLALLNAGLLTQVEAAIAAGNAADKITWEYALEIRRTDSMIINIGAALGLTEAQIDDLFRTAATL